MTGKAAHPEGLVERLARVVADFHAGIARIDRECDEACQRIERSIQNIRAESAERADQFKREYCQEHELRRQADLLGQEIARVDADIARLDQGIAAIEASLQSLMREKRSVEQQIQNRWLIERVFYLFMDDKDKEQLASLQTHLDKGARERTTLEETRRRLEGVRSQLVARRDDKQARLDGFRRKLEAVRRSAETADAQERILADRLTTIEDRRRARKTALFSNVAVAWERVVSEITLAVQFLRQQQPAFADLRGTESCISRAMPKFVLLGAQEVSFQQFRCVIPHSVSFPFEHALLLPKDNQAQRRLAHHLLLRLLQAIPPGQLELTLIDPIQQGQSVAPFLPLLMVEQLVPQRRVLTRADEIETGLRRLTDETECLIQQRFKGRIANWVEFNEANASNPLRFRVVLLFDVPEQLSDKSVWYLARLVENGPRCGILPILAIDDGCFEDGRYGKLRAALRGSGRRLDACLRIEDKRKEMLSYRYLPEDWPQQDALDDFLSMLAKHYADRARLNRALSDLWQVYKRGSTTVNGFDIPIGWTPSGETVSLRLGAANSEHHALVAGKTGSGKSNLLHVIIHSLCEKYGPKEVDLYLLDYKESTEFTVYASPPLPHARLVATESDPEYGVTVLKHLEEELERRAGVFKAGGVRDFSEYRSRHRAPLARILLLIDEFQVLFTEERQVAEEAERLLARLLKQGRSFGIHLLLATQTLKGINALSPGALISQVGCRIALACGPEDSALILSANNWAAAELKSPPEGIINNNNGAKSGNVRFIIPLAEREVCRVHLEQMSERAGKRGIPGKAKVFNGARLPVRPGLDDFRDLCSRSRAMLLGERLTFSSEPLSVPLDNRQSFNVLFSGYNDLIHDGLLVSALASILFVEKFDDIVYFNGRGIQPRDGFRKVALRLGERLRVVSDVGRLPLEEIADAAGERRVALIIDGLDAEKALHPVPTFRIPRSGDPSPPSEVLKRIAEEGPRRGSFVFAFIDNWRRCASLCKELFNLFELRVAFCMDEYDAGALVGGGIGKFRGLEKPNRAVFVNRMTNEVHWFRPYVGEPEVES